MKTIQYSRCLRVALTGAALLAPQAERVDPVLDASIRPEIGA